MNNNDIIMSTISSDQSLEVNEPTSSQDATSSFGVRIKKHLPNKATILSLRDRIANHIEEQAKNRKVEKRKKIDKSLQAKSINITDKPTIDSSTHVLYTSLNGKEILIAAIPKKEIFNITLNIDEYVIEDSKAKIPLHKFIFNSVDYLSNIPETTIGLKDFAIKNKSLVYNYSRDNTADVNRQNLNRGKDFMIYTNGDIYDCSLILMNVTSEWTNPLCVASTKNLITTNQFSELMQNNNLKDMLDAYSSQKTYNFSILANPVMPSLKNTKYLNFFNVSQADVDNIDVKDLEMIANIHVEDENTKF